MFRPFYQHFQEIGSKCLKENVLTTLLIALVVLILVRYLLTLRKKPKLPPGPIGFPILGYYPFLRKDPEIVLTNLAKKYGNVVGFYIGPKYVVFLNDWEAVKDGFSQNATTDRPPNLFENVPFQFGFGGANGVEWIQSRRLVSKAIKDIGLPSTRWEELVQEEVTNLVERIKKEGPHPLEVRSFFDETFVNNILTPMMGKRLPSDDPLVKSMSDSVAAIIKSVPPFEMSNFSWTLHRILQMLGIEEKFKEHDKILNFCSTIENIVEEKSKNLNKNSDDSFFVHFKKEIDEFHKIPENIRITDHNQKGSAIAMLVGGSHTVRASTTWALIAMADHLHIQQKVHEELDKVVGREGLLSWSERFRIPYTFATMLETMRWKTINKIPALRYVSEDIKIQGYDIPKGSFLATNNLAVHNDPRYWSNPDEFIPERFLSDDGKKVIASPDSFNPFSYGKRNCPGKLVALIEDFQYFVILMQNFKVVSKDGLKVKYDLIAGLIHEASNVELCFIPR